MPFQPDLSEAFSDNLGLETFSTFSTLGPLFALLENDAMILLDGNRLTCLLLTKRVELTKDRLAGIRGGKNEALVVLFTSELQCLATPVVTAGSNAFPPLIKLAMFVTGE